MEQEVTVEMLKDSTFDLEIVKYEKWNGERDKEKENNKERMKKWVKIDTHILDDPKVSALPPLHAFSYLRLIFLRGALGRPLKGLTLPWCQARMTFPGCSAGPLLIKLLKLGLIEINNVTKKSPRSDKKRSDKKRSDGADPEITKTEVQRPPKKEDPPPAVATENAQQVIKVFVNAHRTRYGNHTTPHIGPKEAGLAKNLLKTYKVEQLSLMFQVYVQMEDRYFLSKAHDLPTFCANINTVKLALQKGRKAPNEKGFNEYVEELERKNEQRALPEATR